MKHSATVFSAVGEAGVVTVRRLVDVLLSSASTNRKKMRVLHELSFMGERRPAHMIWSLLHYLGIATFHNEFLHYLRVPGWLVWLVVGCRASGRC